MAIDIDEIWLDVIGEDFKLIRMAKGLVAEYRRHGVPDAEISAAVMSKAKIIYDDLPDEARIRKLDLIAGAIATALDEPEPKTTQGLSYPGLGRRVFAGTVAFAGAGF